MSVGKLNVPPVGAAATLIAEKFKDTDVETSHESAVLLFAAIISNTLNFKAGATTERDRAAAAWLKKKSNAPGNLAHKMFLAKSDLAGEKLEAEMQHGFAMFFFGTTSVGVAQGEMVGSETVLEPISKIPPLAI